VAVTQGLLELMNDEELEGVIAHELSHVRNYDILISSIAATLAGAITWIAHWGMWLGGGDGEDRERNVFAELALMILAPLAAMLLQLALSRQREYAADATGARMVGNQYGLMSALQKLGSYNQRIPTTSISPSTSSLCIVKPLFGGGGVASLFSTHPPLEKRIQALREMTVVPRR
jgi:heat shock protein HtpX